MSQKNAKRIRKIEGKVDALQLKFDEAMARASYESDCRDRAQRKASNDRQMRRELEAENTARIWKAVAIGALVAAIIVEIIAIAAVHAKAAEPVPQEAAPANELTIIEPKTPTLAQDDAKNAPIFVTSLTQIADSDEVAEDFENEKIEAALLAGATTVDSCTVTHYCICKECCGKDPDHPDYGVTASGLYALPNITVAVDPDVIPLGSDVLVDYGDGEIHYYVAADTGSGVEGNHIDLCVKDHQTAVELGRKTATVYWVNHEEGA